MPCRWVRVFRVRLRRPEMVEHLYNFNNARRTLHPPRPSHILRPPPLSLSLWRHHSLPPGRRLVCGTRRFRTTTLSPLYQLTLRGRYRQADPSDAWLTPLSPFVVLHRRTKIPVGGDVFVRTSRLAVEGSFEGAASIILPRRVLRYGSRLCSVFTAAVLYDRQTEIYQS